jgi:hypothetical protein
MASAPIESPGGLSCGVPTEVKMDSATVTSLGWGPLRPLRPLHPSCTRSVGILGPGPLCFLFSVFPSRPLLLTPPGRPQTGRSKTLRPASSTLCTEKRVEKTHAPGELFAVPEVPSRSVHFLVRAHLRLLALLLGPRLHTRTVTAPHNAWRREPINRKRSTVSKSGAMRSAVRCLSDGPACQSGDTRGAARLGRFPVLQ